MFLFSTSDGSGFEYGAIERDKVVGSPLRIDIRKLDAVSRLEELLVLIDRLLRQHFFCE